jgi:hypothetical protein
LAFWVAAGVVAVAIVIARTVLRPTGQPADVQPAEASKPAEDARRVLECV